MSAATSTTTLRPRHGPEPRRCLHRPDKAPPPGPSMCLWFAFYSHADKQNVLHSRGRIFRPLCCICILFIYLFFVLKQTFNMSPRASFRFAFKFLGSLCQIIISLLCYGLKRWWFLTHYWQFFRLLCTQKVCGEPITYSSLVVSVSWAGSSWFWKGTRCRCSRGTVHTCIYWMFEGEFEVCCEQNVFNCASHFLQ